MTDGSKRRFDAALFGSAPLVLVYDGWCGVCTRTAGWVCDHDWDRRVTALPSQLPGLLDEIGLTRAEVNRAAWALDRSGATLEGAAAISRVLLELPRWAWLGRLYGVPAIAKAGDLFYRWFARRRGDFARWGSVPTCERRGVACTPEGVDQVPPSVERVIAAARERDLVLQVQEFPEGTRTARDAANAVGVTLGQIVKSLVFVADGMPVIALVSGSNRLDTGKLAAMTGAGTVERAAAEAARGATGYVIGGTPPFGYAQPMPVYIDRDLLKYEVVWAAAGTPHHNFPIAPSELVRCSDGVVADLKE